MSGAKTSGGDAWGEFWAGQSDQGGGGCLAGRWRIIDEAQRRAWHEFARLLPAKAAVLDLATGDGRVMGWLLGTRKDLKLQGVDLAPRIPAPPKGTRSRGGIAMESLPFGDGRFAAIVSQFGFEYGETEFVLAEISRVCRPGGYVGLMTHRLDGPILEHNHGRRAGLAWALDEAELVAKARSSLTLRAMGFGPPPAIMEAPAKAKARFGDGSAGWELAEAISRTLALGRNDRAEEVDNLLVRLEQMARNEIGRIDSLENACRRVADKKDLVRKFGDHELKVQSHHEVLEQGRTRAFSDFWTLRRN